MSTEKVVYYEIIPSYYIAPAPELVLFTADNIGYFPLFRSGGVDLISSQTDRNMVKQTFAQTS